MTKEVLLTISGLHYDAQVSGMNQDEEDVIEVITPATYYQKNGKHYVVYDEVVEGMPGTIRNLIRISEDGLLEISKSGLTNSRMVFEKEKIHMTPYETPYGELMLGVYTTMMNVHVEEENIDVKVRYALDINSEKVANCNITMNICANGKE